MSQAMGQFRTIDFKELAIKRKIGSGNFGSKTASTLKCQQRARLAGEAHLARWRESDVVVKLLKSQELSEAQLAEFKHEAEMSERVGRFAFASYTRLH